MSWLQPVLVLLMFTASCGEVAYQRFERDMWSNYVQLNQVNRGMTKEEVIAIMGQPGIKEEGDYYGGHYNIYFYLTHSMDFEESNTVRNGYTPLVFKDNRLVGIGKREYRESVDRPEAQEVPRMNLPWYRTH